MSKPLVILEAKKVRYYAPHDEDAMFEWIYKLKCIGKVWGQGTVLYMPIIATPSLNELREIIGLFQRYKINMRQLHIFLTEENKEWFADPQKYWFKKVFQPTIENNDD